MVTVILKLILALVQVQHLLEAKHARVAAATCHLLQNLLALRAAMLATRAQQGIRMLFFLVILTGHILVCR